MPGWRGAQYDGDKKIFEENEKIIRNSIDPYKIMSIFNNDRSEFSFNDTFSNRLANLTVKHMTDLIRKDKTTDNKLGIQVIRLVLETMRKNRMDDRIQHLGCSIFAGAGQPDEINENRAAFVFMMDEIQDAIHTASRNHPRAGWDDSSREALHIISSAKQTDIRANQTKSYAACAFRERYFAAHTE